MIVPFDRAKNPISGLRENPDRVLSFVQMHKLDRAATWEWSKISKSERLTILAHLYDQSRCDAAHRGFRELREMFDEGYARKEFLALSQENDFDMKIPSVAKSYLALYYDQARGKFTNDAFYQNYREAISVPA